MPTELEVKLTVAPDQLRSIGDWLLRQPQTGSGESVELRNCYFDTPEAALNRQQIALRIRRSGERFIQTLKTRGEYNAGLHQREEREWPLADAALDLAVLSQTKLARQVDLTQLMPVFETNFTRQIIWIEDGQATIECALDAGVVVAGNRSRPLHELELELKAGDPHQLMVWARAVAQHSPVFLNLISKAEQGYYMADLYRPSLPDSGQEQVYRLLVSLGVHWLTNSARTSVLKALAEVHRLAVDCRVESQWRLLVAQMDSGVAVSDLLQNRALGVLLTALVV